jgi:hypothetical protein
LDVLLLLKKLDEVVAIAREILGLCLVLALLLLGGEAQAGPLTDRLAQFPHWETKPPVTAAVGDLVYPVWMEGTWNVTSTLVDQVAPIAPEVVTPGFESNRRYLNQPVNFLVRFQSVSSSPMDSAPAKQTAISDCAKRTCIADRFLPLKTPNSGPIQGHSLDETPVVVADRAFNGLNIAKAYLGDRVIQFVKVDPNSPNRQITSLRTGRQLISIVTGRASEMPAPDQFIATEVSNQVFRGIPQPYFNQVETTTAYQLLRETKLSPTPKENPNGRELPSLEIKADQVTAVYLSPLDPDYFKAQGRPVALYRYRLKLLPLGPI